MPRNPSPAGGRGVRLGVEYLESRDVPNAGVPGLIAVGADAGGLPEVRFLDESGNLRRSFLAFDESFRGGVRTAVGDITGDGVADIVVAPGIGGGPFVKVFDGGTGREVSSFLAYDPAFRGGVSLAVGAVNGRPVIVTGPGPGGGPHVKMFDGRTSQLLTSLMAYDPRFPGGVNVAFGDVLGDNTPIIVTAPGPGGGPHVRLFDAVTGFDRGGFMAFDPAFTGGVAVAAGDVAQLGYDAVVVGAGAGGGPLVNVVDARLNLTVQSFYAFTPDFRGGVNVGVVRGGPDTADRLITAAGPTGGPQVNLYDYNRTITGGAWGYGLGGFGLGGFFSPYSFFAFPSFFGGGVAFGTGLGIFGGYTDLYEPYFGPSWFFDDFAQPVYIYDGEYVEPGVYEYDPSYQFIEPAYDFETGYADDFGGVFVDDVGGYDPGYYVEPAYDFGADYGYDDYGYDDYYDYDYADYGYGDYYDYGYDDFGYYDDFGDYWV